MNADFREQLSATMDGELGKDELRFLLRRVDRDPELGDCWFRYHVARHALRRQEVVPLRGDFAAVIFERIQQESAPARQRLPVLRWASGGAIAAAVAVAALVVTRPASELVPGGGDLAATGAQRMNSQALLVNPPAAAAPASATTSTDTARVGAMPSMGIPAMPASSTVSDWSQAGSVDQRLAPYLIRHYQATGQSGSSAVVPYVLMAAPAGVVEEGRASAGGHR